MRVLMRVHLVMQDAGVERPLNVGGVYALPDALAQQLIAQGAAELDPVALETGAFVDAPEHKGARPRRRRRCRPSA